MSSSATKLSSCAALGQGIARPDQLVDGEVGVNRQPDGLAIGSLGLLDAIGQSQKPRP